MGVKEKIIYLASGGTGGHLFPAVALARKIASRGDKPILLTDERGGSLVRQSSDLEVIILPLRKRGGGLYGRLRFHGALLRCVLSVLRQFRKQKPDLIVGFGGYPSFPVVIASMLKNKKLLLHEQNAYLGMVNRYGARCARKIAVSFRQTYGVPPKDREKVSLTGMPVREEITRLYKSPYPRGSADDPFTILVIGGSQGAAFFSHLVPHAIAQLPDKIRAKVRIIQQSRPELLATTRQVYEKIGVKAHVEIFFHNIHEELEKANLVIARAGASTVAELRVAGRPAILIPYPHAKDDHQLYNARLFEKEGGGYFVEEKNASVVRVAKIIERFIMDKSFAEKMARNLHESALPDADDRLLAQVDLLLEKPEGKCVNA